MFDKEAFLRPDHMLDEESFDESNKQLSSIFSMYGGYIQMSLNARDDVMESRFMKLVFKQIKILKEQVEQKDNEVETLKFMVEAMTNDELTKEQEEEERLKLEN